MSVEKQGQAVHKTETDRNADRHIGTQTDRELEKREETSERTKSPLIIEDDIFHENFKR